MSAYTARRMEIAVSESRKIGIRPAARKYGIPQTQLWKACKTGHGLDKDGFYHKQDPSKNRRYLTDAEEAMLVSKFQTAARHGAPYTQVQAQQFVVDLLEKKYNRPGQGKRVIPIPTKKFWRGFSARHSEVTLLLSAVCMHNL